MKTALVRLNGNLQIIRNDYYSTNKEMQSELTCNGYKVLKVWNGNKSDAEVYDILTVDKLGKVKNLS